MIKIIPAIIISILLFNCSVQKKHNVPESIGDKTLAKIIEKEQAKKILNELHGLTLADQENIIAEYGTADPDILYLAKFDSDMLASSSFEQMLDKMKKNEKGIFTFLVPMKNYNQKSYMTIGLGFVHYIYKSGNYVIWFSTKQKFYNTLPAELINVFPVN